MVQRCPSGRWWRMGLPVCVRRRAGPQVPGAPLPPTPGLRAAAAQNWELERLQGQAGAAVPDGWLGQVAGTPNKREQLPRVTAQPSQAALPATVAVCSFPHPRRHFREQELAPPPPRGFLGGQLPPRQDSGADWRSVAPERRGPPPPSGLLPPSEVTVLRPFHPPGLSY